MLCWLAIGLFQRIYAQTTSIGIQGNKFLINNTPTYQGTKVEGLLLNARMVQGIFDDENNATRPLWVYPDTKQWDAARNTMEFVRAMPAWRQSGLLSFTLNLQGGSPTGYNNAKPWLNSAFDPTGGLKPAYLARLKQILDKANQLGMAPILGLFYFGQDQHLQNEQAVVRGVNLILSWLHTNNFKHVMVEVDNECDNAYHHAILRCGRVPELIRRVQARGFLTSVSLRGGVIPPKPIVEVSDFILLHGNGVHDPRRITDMIRAARKASARPKPILVTEDDHFNFNKTPNNFQNALNEYASWGFFDPGASDYATGFQCPPVQWQINTQRKKDFFQMVKRMTTTRIP